MKQMKRIVALFLGLIMLFSCIVPVSAANAATLSAGTVEGSAGDRVIVPISIDRNGGFVSLSLSVTYDMSALTLVSVHDTGLIDGGYHSPYYDSPYYLSWENDVRTSNYTVTGVIVELEFLIEEDAQNKDYSIVVRMNSDGALDKDGEEVFFTLNSGKITVAEPEHVCSFGKWDDYNRKKHVRICDECGEREYENHNWNDGEILEEPSCDSDGEILYTCEDCGYEKYDWIDAEPHEYDDWIKYDDEQHMRVCSNCDDEEFAPHDWVQNSNGFVCADCGATRSDAPPPHEHRFVEYYIFQPDCTQQGYTEYRCEICLESKKENYLSALGHNYKDGSCTRCGLDDPNHPGDTPDTQYDYDIGIDNLDTMYFVDSGEAVIFFTIKNYGIQHLMTYRLEVYRDAPDGEMVYNRPIPSLESGETFDDSFIAHSDPSKTEIYYILLVPDMAINEDQNMVNNFAVVITKTISEDCYHSFTKWMSVNENQHACACDDCGKTVTYEHFFMPLAGNTCLLCGSTQSLPHEHRFTEYFTYRPTCTQQGYTEYRCEDCFESKNDNYIPALGHDYVNGVCDRCDAVDPNPGKIPVTGIKLNKSSATLKVGGSTLLEATITPGDATNRNIIWTVSDPSVVQMNISVSKIYADVIGLAPGTATITAKSADGAFIAQCVVTVEGDSVPEESFNLVLSAEEAMAGETVDVTVNLSDNPGITSLVFKVHYDLSLLTLTNVTYNTGMGGQTVSPKPLTSPVTLYWVNGLEDYSGNGLFATLTFTVSEDAKEGDVAAITVSHNADDVFNVKEDNVAMNVTAGQVTVINYVPGDINGDGIRNNKDVTRFMQYNAGWDVEVNTYALDVNGDGTVSNKDVTRLMQYNAGWDVEIH